MKEAGKKTLKSIDKGRIRAKRKKKKIKIFFFLSENVNVPIGYRSSKFPVPGSETACHGDAGMVFKKP